MQITQDMLFELLMTIKRATPVTIVTETEPKMLKTDNPYAGKVVKVSRVNGMINWSYERAVNKALAAAGQEPAFEPQPRTWGHRVPGTCLVTHEHQNYVELKVQNSFGHEYRDRVTGEVIPDEKIKPFLPKQRENPVAPGVVLRDYKLGSIRQISVGGQVHQIS